MVLISSAYESMFYQFRPLQNDRVLFLFNPPTFMRGKHVVSTKKEVTKQAQIPLFYTISFKRCRKSQNKHKVHSFFISFKRCQNSQDKQKFHSFILLHSSVVRKGFISCLHVRPFLVAEADRTHLAYNHPSERFR